MSNPFTMTFGEAIEKARQGHRIRRAGWNGAGMWVWHMPAVDLGDLRLALDQCDNHRLDDHFHLPSETVVAAHFWMYTAQKTLQPGWLASQADMLATDWEVVS